MLRYKLVQRKDMTKGALEGSKLYYPQVVNQGRVSFDSPCEEVAEQSALTSGDIKSCMDRLVNCLVRHLKEGRSVDCGDLGSFRINIRSTGADTPETYDAATMMRKPSIQYYLGKKLRDMQDTGVQYERYTPPTNG